MAQPLAQEKLYTEADYYNLPADVRAELIDGRFYYQAAPNRIHQEILNYQNTEINLYTFQRWQVSCLSCSICC